MWQILAALFYLLSLTTGDVYYVSSRNNPENCPVDYPCYNLSYYVNNSELYFTDDTIFYFQEGTHTLEQDELVMISDVSNLTLTAQDESFVSIICLESVGGLAFFMCNDIAISMLHFYNCGGIVSNEQHDHLVQFSKTRISLNFFGYTRHTFLFFRVTDLTIYEVSVQNSTGYALAAINTFDVELSYSTFSYNNIASYSDPICNITNGSESLSCYGGNVYFLYADPRDCSPDNETYYYLNISHSTFNYGVNIASEFLNAGLGIGMFQSASYGIDVTIESVTTIGNTAYRGANFAFAVVNTASYHTLTINNLVSMYGNAIYLFPQKINSLSRNKVDGSGFLFLGSIVLIVYCENTITRQSHNSLTLTNSVFMHNIAREGGGAWINPWPGVASLNRRRYTRLENCIFFNNSGEFGSALFIWQFTALKAETLFDFLLKNVSIKNNHFINLTSISDDTPSAVLILFATNVTFNNVTISDHNITGLHIYNTLITIVDANTTINNNKGMKGGGIYMRGNSEFIFKPPANLILSNNNADFGGGLFVQQETLEDDGPLCFFQIEDESSLITGVQPNTHIYSFNNIANTAGDFLYGSTGALLDCELTTLFLYYHNSTKAFEELVVYNNYDSLLTISSNQVKVCFCNNDGHPNCTELTRKINVLPGAYFDINITAVGLKDGITSGIVNDRYVTNNNREVNGVTRLDRGCTLTRYKLNKLGGITVIYLTVADSTVPTSNTPLAINLTMLPCPNGFKFSPDIGYCTCNDNLIDNTITCNTTTWNISRTGNDWITYDKDENCTIVSDCPFDYCDTSLVTFNITFPDPQCAHNRAGTLCGQCAEGFSLMLGSNSCKKCNNKYLSLLIVYALAGIVLVIFIFALNLTVTMGTINGLIFYANIIKINEPEFFPNGSIPVLSQFISWLNLDLGIEICFFDGLTAYGKTWLQFLFPLYIGTIVVIIIILCQYSRRLSKLAGNNAVPVLATLILLSYTKVLRAIIAVIQLGIIRCSGHVHSLVWSVDGSVHYFEGKHIILLAVAVLVFVFIAIPYTMLSLFIPLIERKTPRCLKWILKLKPYFDATCGEFHDDYRFWGGFLLLVRLILALIIPFTPPKIDTSSILGASVLIMFIIWNLPLAGLYKKRYLDILESWFFLNLAFMSIASLTGSAYVGTIVSTSLVLVSFFGIIVFHIVMQIQRYKRQQILVKVQEGKLQCIFDYLSKRSSTTQQQRQDGMKRIHAINTFLYNEGTREHSPSVVRRRDTYLDEVILSEEVEQESSTSSCYVSQKNSGSNTGNESTGELIMDDTGINMIMLSSKRGQTSVN